MVSIPNSLWVCVNPNLIRFDQRLANLLNRQADVQRWTYRQSADEPCCINTALDLLHDHMRQQPQPIHLIGHGLSGALSLLYARMYPHRVKSLTLLSVGSNPAVGWHSHYYALRKLLPCRREMILAQMARMLFGPQNTARIMGLAKLLANVLDSELTPNSLMGHSGFSPGGIEAPLLICCGGYDTIVDPNTHGKWQLPLVHAINGPRFLVLI